ncbi:BMC domain-containing protein [Clostridium minihomine]|uniref:BMC domain-containing protein n=1 Tax=Clostridium minihomine TaxID=2045012 RepID=UPI000C755D9B|nr:BMC domain-containing protein [Clostridium minihomine]
MQALGLIETKGLLAAIEGTDVMLKTAAVELVEKTFVGGGLVSIVVTGDVGAVKAAVEAGAAAVTQIDPSLLISQHVMPRPHQELAGIVGKAEEPDPTPPEEPTAQAEPELETEPEAAQENPEPEAPADPSDSLELPQEMAAAEAEQMHKSEIDSAVRQNGIEGALELLRQLRVVKLRNLAREYQGMGLSGRQISKADKGKLMTEFRRYYEQKEQENEGNEHNESNE